MFGAMIFNSLTLLSLLTVAITLTVLGIYAWAGVFYALSLFMLTKVGVDTTKEIRHEMKMNKRAKRYAAEDAAAAAPAAASTEMPSPSTPVSKTMSPTRRGTELTCIVEEKAVCVECNILSTIFVTALNDFKLG